MRNGVLGYRHLTDHLLKVSVRAGWGPIQGTFINRSGYFRSYFNQSVFDYKNTPKGCRLHDDVWISGVLWKYAKVRPYLLKPGFKSVLQHRAWDNLTIHMVENGESEFRDPCIEYFNWFV